MTSNLVSIKNVSIGFPSADGFNKVTDGVSFDIAQGEVLALVGESGSGKTIISKALLQLLPDTAKILSGSVNFKGTDVSKLKGKALLQHRGADIGMVFQEPLTSLNPALKIGEQLAEGLKLHRDMSPSERQTACINMLMRVKMQDPERAMSQYPHEFSGGMRQRIMLASVMLLKPALLVADEPTTALDVMIQKEVLDIMLGLVREEGISLLLVTHDLALVSEYADKIAVMEKGLLVETGPAASVLQNPQHAYTQRLLNSVPGKKRRAKRSFPEAPIIEATNVQVSFSDKPLLWWRKRTVYAVKSTSLSIRGGETLALVGESGSGKSTFGRALLGLTDMAAGDIRFDGQAIAANLQSRTTEERRKMQLVFQDPFSSLNPRMTLEVILKESLRHDKSLSRTDKNTIVSHILSKVGLPIEFANRLPHELSGGQRQRVCIARAMITEPTFIVADEPVSALDVTVQAQVLQLLKQLQEDQGFALLFISHDLAVVEEIADRVMVMYHGHIVEEGTVDQVFDTPLHPYTVALLNAAPRFRANPDTPAATNIVTNHLDKRLSPTPLSLIRASGTALSGVQYHEENSGHKVSILTAEDST
ncbi:MAG: ABC transporter ATP-binding protein [Kordiimonadaceae bacterium]|nr:ABC transporter ATP-binding protein [Kordiimonadaceae bacterium]